jgi:hypothetical protein
VNKHYQPSGYLKKFFINVLLAGLGCLVALGCIELGLHLIPEEVIDSIIERSSQRLVLYRLDPRIGWTLRPRASSVITTPDNRVVPLVVNSLGLRDNEHPYKKPDHAFRILILGDSFAEADDLYLEEAFPYLIETCLRQKLNRPVEVINGGVSGYNIADEYLFYQAEGYKYQPDLVLVMFYAGNDLYGLARTLEERLVTGFGGYRFTLNQGRLNQTWVDWEYPHDNQTSAIELFLRRYSRLWRILAYPESKIYVAYREQMEKLSRSLQPDDAEDKNAEIPEQFYFHVKEFPDNPIVPPKVHDLWSVFRVIMAQLQIEIKANGSQMALVILPADYQVEPQARSQAIEEMPVLDEEKFSDQWQPFEPNQAVMREMKKQSIPAFDLLPYFQAHAVSGGAPLYFEGYDEHLNREGHAVTANAICNWLISDRLVSQLSATIIK